MSDHDEDRAFGPLKTFTVDSLAVRIYASQEDLAADAAREAQQYLRGVLAEKGHAAIILASATSQVKFLEAFTGLSGLDWSRITVFHMDEYLGISPDHLASFRRFLRERVVSQVKPGTVHYLEGDAEEPFDESDRYAQLLGRQPIDLCCLGIGENGHIAFNDPPVADFADPRPIKIVRLDKECRLQQVGEGFYPNLESVPKYAYTLTIPTLCAAKKMLCIVPEQRKAMAVQQTLEGPIQPACPASFLRRQPQATLCLDSASASRLKGF